VKLLFDENLSPFLAGALSDLFPQSTHVRVVGLKSSPDPDVWQFAVENDFVIVSKDADLHDRSLLYGFPPKVIWIRLGNCSTKDVETLIRNEIEQIKVFIGDDVASFLALS
jgi:predicted nuclease of predicted toxin-antitoxin system